MSEIACNLGCFICSGVEGGPHDGQCCASKTCNSGAWDRQTKKWLDAETKWKKNAGAMTTRWLIAEQLYHLQVKEWLSAELQHHTNVEDWLLAEQQHQAVEQQRQRERRVKKVNRVNVPARPRTPTTSATKKAQAVLHGAG